MIQGTLGLQNSTIVRSRLYEVYSIVFSFDVEDPCTCVSNAIPVVRRLKRQNNKKTNKIK